MHIFALTPWCRLHVMFHVNKHEFKKLTETSENTFRSNRTQFTLKRSVLSIADNRSAARRRFTNYVHCGWIRSNLLLGKNRKNVRGKKNIRFSIDIDCMQHTQFALVSSVRLSNCITRSEVEGKKTVDARDLTHRRVYIIMNSFAVFTHWMWYVVDAQAHKARRAHYFICKSHVRCRKEN